MTQVAEQIQYDGAFLDGSGTPITGLTDVVITVYNHAGTAVATAAACTEIASSGVYRYTLSGGSVTAVGDYVGKMSTATATVPYKTIVLAETVTAAASGASAASIADAVWDEAISGHLTAGTTGAALNTAGNAADPLLNLVPGAYGVGTAGYVIGSLTGDQLSVTFASPVIEGGDVGIEAGDAYLNADGRALLWSSDDWPDLTGATCSLVWYVKGKSAAVLSVSGTVVNPGAATQSTRFDLSATNTNALSRGKYIVKVRATLASTAVVTLVSAEGTVNFDD